MKKTYILINGCVALAAAMVVGCASSTIVVVKHLETDLRQYKAAYSVL
jgi:hypothetical protein